MKYSYHKPNPLLIEYIQTVLILEDIHDPETSNLPLVTNGMPALLCQVEEDKHELTIFGQSVPIEKWIAKPNVRFIVFFFKPFSIGPIFNLSAKELKIRPIELSIWDEPQTIALNSQLSFALSTDEKIGLLDHFVLSQFQHNRRECEIIKFATDEMMKNPVGDILMQILEKLALTERTFQRVFKKYVGISPNQYRRICQFHFAFFQLRGKDFDKLSDVAYANGYFDQSHYIRSFKEFTETTPNDYLQFGLKKKK